MDNRSDTALQEGSSAVTWDEVKDAQLDDALRATPEQRLAWLEDAIRLAWGANASRGDERAEP
jgi:hypothetical protein